MDQQKSHFIHHEIVGGLCLLLAAIAALCLANSPWAGHYNNVLHAPLTVGMRWENRFLGLSEPVSTWINEALMAVFFLYIGLEIKYELLRGELSSRTRALQPVFAVFCGMSMPVLIYFLVNRHHAEFWRGWATPCATDIAFALGVLTLVGKRVPFAIKMLLTAIAVLDDLTAILIIAVFYSKTILWAYLVIAAAGIMALALLKYIRHPFLGFYLLAGFFVWLGFLEAGIHPTLAGVVTALFIPLGTQEAPPLKRLEKALQPLVIFAILPLFTFANAGLSFAGLSFAHLLQPLSLSVFLGLVIGKPLGIMTGLGLGHVTKLARKPDGFLWRHYLGMAVLCGMGFTIPLFVGDVAFESPEHLNQVKLGVLSACLLSGGIGWSICRILFKIKGRTHA